MTKVAGITTNAAAAADRLRATQVAIQAELRGERQLLANRIAARMRVNAPKGARSTLANSVRTREVSDTETIIEPAVDYAKWVVAGRRPGKGLPFFGTPAAASAMAWVQMLLSRGAMRGKVEELSLRVAYFQISVAMKKYGIKPENFVKRTADEIRAEVHARLVAAVRRGVAQGKAGLA